MEEYEIKFLEINVVSLEKELLKIGAQKVSNLLYRRVVFDFPDFRLNKDNSWLRLRDEGDKITLTYKKRLGIGENKLKDEGMHEVEIIVSDFKIAAELCRSLGMVEKFYEENKRTKYILDNVEFCIDEWPLIPPYLEIEGKSWDSVKEMTNRLGLKWEDSCRCATMQVYEKYSINENDYSILTFENQTKK